MDDPSIEHLRRESELARENLRQTVGELRQRFGQTSEELQSLLSPAHVKQELTAYAREKKESLYNRVEARLRENPLQTAAIGLGLAYPVVSLLRRAPIPMMLLGAGVFLARQRRTGAEPNTGPVSRLRNAADSAVDVIKDAPSIVSSLGQQIETKLDETAAAASEKLDEITTAASERIERTAARASEAFSHTVNAASHTASAAQSKAKAAARNSRDSIGTFVDRNPLAVAGLGLGLGAVIAALLPATRTEARVLGPVANRLKEEAMASAGNAMASAKSAAEAKIDSMAGSLQREGLGTDGLSQAVSDLTERVKTVAERGTQIRSRPIASEYRATGIAH